MAVSVARMAIYLPNPGYKGRTFELCVLTRWKFNFCVRNSPQRGNNSSISNVKNYYDCYYYYHYYYDYHAHPISDKCKSEAIRNTSKRTKHVDDGNKISEYHETPAHQDWSVNMDTGSKVELKDNQRFRCLPDVESTLFQRLCLHVLICKCFGRHRRQPKV